MFDVRERAILVVVAGSRAYGMNTPTSDTDMKGVVIPPASYYLGLDSFKVADGKEHVAAFASFFQAANLPPADEGSLYEIVNAIKLSAIDCNPNMFEVFFGRPKDIMLASFLGMELRAGLQKLALSAKAKHSCSGMAMSQLARMKRRKADFDSGKDVASERNDVRRELENKYGYDTKHAAHVVRCLRMGKEILLTGECHVYRPDAAELLAIRNGAWSFQQVDEYARQLDAELTDIYDRKAYVVPHSPDVKELNKLATRLVKMALDAEAFDVAG